MPMASHFPYPIVLSRGTARIEDVRSWNRLVVDLIYARHVPMSIVGITVSRPAP